jgi:hypothetical protein
MKKHPVTGRDDMTGRTPKASEAAAELQERAQAHPGVADVMQAVAVYQAALRAARAASPFRTHGSTASASAAF